MIKVDLSDAKINNKRDRTYMSFLLLLNDFADSETKDELLFSRQKIDILLTRISGCSIDGLGIIDYKNTIKFINSCYQMAKYYCVNNLIKFIYNDMINLCQNIYIMHKSIPEEKYEPYEIAKAFHQDLYLISFSYFYSRYDDIK